MKLFEMRSHPKTAEAAMLHFLQDNDPAVNNLPFRREEIIMLPDNPEAEFFPLQNGRQFLMRLQARNEPQIWFGGTDERPFLVRLKPEVFKPFMDNGEDGFYDTLKPPVIHRGEKDFNMQSLRQGDIFALPLPHSWEELMRVVYYSSNGTSIEDVVQNEDAPLRLFGTRHTLQNRRTYSKDKAHSGGFLIAEGTLEAPDHSPKELKGPHLIVQATNLYEPPKAD